MLGIVQTVAPYALVLASLGLLWSMFHVIRSIIRRNPYEATDHSIVALSIVYAVGVMAKFAAIGPEFLRFYVSDIGFPVMLMMIWTIGADPRTRTRQHFANASYLDQLLLLKGYKKYQGGVLVAALCLSYLYEVVMGMAVSVLAESGAQNPGVGGFDWGDIAAYTVGAAVAALLLRTYSRALDFRIEREMRRMESARVKRRRPRKTSQKPSK